MLYGVPKIHKKDVPLRPILSMINAPQHEMAKWLAELLKPVLKKYSAHATKDTFEFVDDVREFGQQQAENSGSLFLCSFDVVSLFTNVPLKETIDICIQSLYHDDEISAPQIPQDLFKKLLFKATSDVQFSFNGNMYAQRDGVAMGSPLGPVLANIFVGYFENTIPDSHWPQFYRRYVDDTFAAFHNRKLALEFSERLNNLHPALQFTMEEENNGELPFLDVLIKHSSTELLTTVYRKPTFTGLYTRWDSFCDTRNKINLIRSLTFRAKTICSPSLLSAEIAKLEDILCSNGYPLKVLKRVMTSVLEPSPDTASAQLEPATRIITKLPWKGQNCIAFRKKIKAAILNCYPTVSPIVIYTTRPAFRSIAKDVSPTLENSNFIYKYACRCERTYVGETCQRFSERIKQHIPDKLYKKPPDKRVATSDSAITKHLQAQPECIPQERNSSFSVITPARNSAHRFTLEALYIRSLRPELCRQKKHIKVLRLFKLQPD